MTIPLPSTEVCALCGKEVTIYEYAAYTTFGTDLDGRPISTGRGVEFMSVNLCPHCGYASDYLPFVYPGVEDFVKSDKYQAVIASDLPHDAKKFVCAVMIEEHKASDQNLDSKIREDAYVDAAHYALKAAWAFEDAKDEEKALEYRKIAIHYFEIIRAQEAGTTVISQGSIALTLADLYRRSSNFDACILLSRNWTSPESKLCDLVGNESCDMLKDFFLQEIKFAEAKDTGSKKAERWTKAPKEVKK